MSTLRKAFWLAAAFAVLEATLATVTFVVRPGPMTILAGQVAVDIGAALLGITLYTHGERSPIVILVLLSVAALGPIGIAGSLTLVACAQLFSGRAKPFADWYETLFQTVDADEPHDLFRLIAVRNAGPAALSTVAPFLDVLALGTTEQKQSLLTLVSDHFRPEFAPALLRALNDVEPAIRVQAATATARIENAFLERSLALMAQKNQRPDDRMVIRKIAEHNETYARTGLLDAGRAASARASALELYRMLLRDTPDDAAVARSVAQLLLELGRPEESVAILMPFAYRGALSAEAVATYAEGLFLTRQYVALRELCARHGPVVVGEGEGEVRCQAVGLWTSATA
jgi:hypothetical protein